MARKNYSKKSKSTVSSPDIRLNDNKKKGILKNVVVSLEAKAASLKKYSHFTEIIVLFLIILTGIFCRIEDISLWKTYAQKAFFNNQPLHTTFDAYFYLSLAKDIVDGTYNKTDEKRSVPDCPPRPSPPPLISVLAAGIAKVTPFSLSWIGAILPAILGPLLAIPLYLLGRYYGGPLMGFTASLIALMYPFYVYRSNLGRFDTDCLNVTFILSSSFVFLRFGTIKTLKRYVYFFAGVLVYGLFLWWWDQTPAVVTALTFMPFAVALVFFYRPAKKEALVFLSFLGFCLLCLIIFKGLGTVFEMIKSLFLQYLYISKDTSGDFPNIGVTISEQSRPSLDSVVSYTTNNIFAFLFSLAGIALLFWKNFKNCLFLISIIILSVLAFTYANRFLIFFIPMLALGTGYAFSFLWKLRHRFLPLYFICPFLLLFFVLPLYNENRDSVQWPKESGPIVAAMDLARQKTPPDSVIWAWWDHGYALTYFARRATINDGSVHSGERTMYTSIPYTTDSYRMSANFMHFYVKQGMQGIHQFCDAAGKNHADGFRLIKEILDAGPENARTILENVNPKSLNNMQSTTDWLKFFFPPDKRPVYLLVDNLLTKITHWWFWFGTWDIATHNGTHPFYSPLMNVQVKNGRIFGSNGLNLDIETGEFQFENSKAAISGLAIREKGSLKEKKYYNTSKYRFELFEQGRFGALMDVAIAESVFNKLFIRHVFPGDYFQPVDLNSPVYQLWEVKGDTFKESVKE